MAAFSTNAPSMEASPAGVSYVVTVYNKARYLEPVLQALEAERQGTGGEIIIVDDGSTDEGPAVIAAFGMNKTGVTVITQQNKGVAAATNAGIAAARCSYLRLVDGDDNLVAGSTVRLMEALRQTGCGFAFGRFAREGNGKTYGAESHAVTVITDPLRYMIRRQPFVPSTCLGLTLVMRQVLPLPEDIRTSQDFALGLKLAAITGFAGIDTLCCVMPVAVDGLSADKARMFRDTVILTARIASQQEWGASLRRFSLVRSAGRARNYLRRHRPRETRAILAVSALAVIARLPLPWPTDALMKYLAEVYCSK